MARYIYTKVSAPIQDAKTPEHNFKFHPLVPVSLISTNGQEVHIREAYIDTGAQNCLFNNDIASRLGIKDFRATEGVRQMCGIGGKKPENIAYFHSLKLVVYKDTKNRRLDNAWQINTRIGFLEKPIGFAGILGVYGFLDQFVFKTNIPGGCFEIEPVFE